MSRLLLDRLLKRLDVEGGLGRYRIGAAEVGSPALAEKADVGTRLFLGISIDWLSQERKACRLLRVPCEGESRYVLTVEERLEALASACSLEQLDEELGRLELDAVWLVRPVPGEAAR
ncbi:MAG TPA: hypothetical protein VGE01_14065 [Fimbriimonas sp.]